MSNQLTKENKGTSECGYFKHIINTALFKNTELCEFVCGDNYKKLSTSEKRKAFKSHFKSHLYIDEVVKDAGLYVYYDVFFPKVHPQVKQCKIVLQVMSHRDTIDDNTVEGYYGNASDILAQMIENTLLNNYDITNAFGIGELNLDSNLIYNATRFYGRTLTFVVDNFR
jgi:hypothetical protein